MAVEVTKSGVVRDGKEIVFFDLSVPGMKARVMNYGGIIMRVEVPDRDGKLTDVVLGFDKLEDYFTRSPYFGALVGRYANRIAGASFTLDGIQYNLPANSHGNTIHGGEKGFDKRVMDWEVTGESSVRFTYVSPDMEEGFPGNLTLHAEYTLTDDHALHLTYTATTDKPTVVSITNHSYFNLSGEGDVLDQDVTIAAEEFTEVSDKGIPTGRLLSVEGTPMDFRQSHKVGERYQDPYTQLAQLGGYDHNYVITTEDWVASAYSPRTGIKMQVKTNMPGMQFYMACNLRPTDHAKGDNSYGKFGALCFETQYYPDSPNHPEFPSPVLRPGEEMRAWTVYKFSTD